MSDCLGTIYSGSKTVAKMLYPLDSKKEIACYATSAVLAISVFVISILTAYAGIDIPGVGWICLGLSVGSFGFAVLGGVMKHSFDARMENMTFRGINLAKWHVGRGKEVVFTLALTIICLVGALTNTTDSLHVMAKNIFITQLVSAGLYYGILGVGIPLIRDSAAQFFGAKQNSKEGYLTELVRQGYDLGPRGRFEMSDALEIMGKHSAYMLAAAAAITALVLNAIAIGGIQVPNLEWYTIGLTAGSFGLLMLAGLRHHNVTWDGVKHFRLGYWKEIIQTVALGTLCALALTHQISTETMAISIVATQVGLTGIYAILAHQFRRKQKERELIMSNMAANDVNESGGGADAPVAVVVEPPPVPPVSSSSPATGVTDPANPYVEINDGTIE